MCIEDQLITPGNTAEETMSGKGRRFLKNRYLMNGHNYQNPRLAIYLPGNGGLLTTAAKMCVSGQFPHSRKWKVRWEDLNEYVD